MIQGSFENGQPFIKAFISLPEIGVEGSIFFLVDTGAEVSPVMPADGHRLFIEYDALSGERASVIGVGGSIRSTLSSALIYFTKNTGKVRLYRTRVTIMPDQPALRRLPSLLGQDILSRWRTVHDPGRGILQATALSADRTLYRRRSR